MAILALGLLAVCPARAQVEVANPNWNITLSDFGYSDLLLDNTPGFEGREYLSGEWAAAVSYRVGLSNVSPTWLEPNFIFPDWVTNSNFAVVQPITPTATDDAGRVTSAVSRIQNTDLRITLSYAMIDTVTGMKMGTSPASAGSVGSIDSNRYALQQTYAIENISGSTIENLSLFQLLHGLNSVTSLYDDRNYGGPSGAYRYDTTQVAVDTTYSGSGSTFRDYIGFGSSVQPVAFDSGRYGIVGVDDHVTGKPSVGLHLSIESDSLANSDYFSPAEMWVAGAQKYAIGSLGSGQSVSFDVLLSVRTGTIINSEGEQGGSCGGGSGVPGGIDYHFANVTRPGDFFAEYSAADRDEINEHILEGDFTEPDFDYPGLLQLYELEFTGEFDGVLTLVLGYDDLILPGGFDENLLAVYHFDGERWKRIGGDVDALLNTIQFETESLSDFALGIVPEPAAGLLLTAGTLLSCRRRRIVRG